MEMDVVSNVQSVIHMFQQNILYSLECLLK